MKHCCRAVLDAARTAISEIPNDFNSSTDWYWDYEIDATGQTRAPRIWVREAIAALDEQLRGDDS